MKEHLYQLSFGADLQHPAAVDVTPSHFKGLESRQPEPLSRFVREVQRPVAVTTTADAARYLMERIFSPFEQFDQEELWTLLVNSRLQVTHEVLVYRGSVDAIAVRNAELLKEAVRVNAPALILSHNHPSGDPTPSAADLITTRQLGEATKLLGIRLLDHLVIGQGTWASIKDLISGF